MNELGFWQVVAVVAPPFIGIWLVYKLACIPIWWLEFPTFLRYGAAVMGGIAFPVVILWMIVGPLWPILLFVTVSGLDAAVFTAVRVRRKRREEEDLKFIKKNSEEGEDGDYSFTHFHQR